MRKLYKREAVLLLPFINAIFISTFIFITLVIIDTLHLTWFSVPPIRPVDGNGKMLLISTMIILLISYYGSNKFLIDALDNYCINPNYNSYGFVCGLIIPIIYLIWEFVLREGVAFAGIPVWSESLVWDQGEWVSFVINYVIRMICYGLLGVIATCLGVRFNKILIKYFVAI